MTMQNVLSRVHKTIIRLEIEIQTTESSSKRDNYRYYNISKGKSIKRYTMNTYGGVELYLHHSWPRH
jgi:hypothetical protein